jgi:ferritin-like metal-binding protein YciE
VEERMRDTKDTINSYITDMLSLEEHIDKAITGQIEDLKDDPQIVADLKAVQRSVQHHVSDLKQLSEARQATTATDAIKRAGSGVLGFAAGLIDLVRSEGLAKNLRDDYAALSLAAIGYVMLNTTALALDDREVADLASQHLRDYTKALVGLHSVIPAAVVRFLQQEGLPARPDVLNEVYRNVTEAWRDGEAERVHTGEATTVRGTRS